MVASFIKSVQPLPKRYYDLRPRKVYKPVVEQSVFKDPEPIEELFNEVVESVFKDPEPIEELFNEVVKSKQETKSNPGKSGRRKKD